MHEYILQRSDDFTNRFIQRKSQNVETMNKK